MRHALVHCCTDKSSCSPDMRQWSWYEMDFARQVNSIQLVDMHSGGLFNWDTQHLDAKLLLDLPFQCCHTRACAACMEVCIRTVEVESVSGPCIGLVPCADVAPLHDTVGAPANASGCFSGKYRISKVIKDCFNYCRLQARSGQLAMRFYQNRAAFHAPLSNAWHSDNSLKDSAFRWRIKACSGQLVTPAVICLQWREFDSPACPMPNCNSSYCDDTHILQSCAWRKRWITYRHDQLKLPTIRFIERACGHWRYIGQPDCAPPPDSVPND